MSSINDSKLEAKLHIVMFPWLAFGHMIPYLELAKHISHRGHKVSFISTPRNIDRLPKPPPDLTSNLHFVKLQFPKPPPNLPENGEATIDVPYNKVKYLKLAYDQLKQPFLEFLQSSNPDWILHDFAPYWLPEIANNLGISTAFFSIFIAALLAFLGPPSSLLGLQDVRDLPEDFTVPPKWVPFPSTNAFRLFEVLKVFDSVKDDGENVSDLYRFGHSIKGCDIIAVRSCFELEPEWISLLQSIYVKPVIPVGELPTTQNENMETNEDWKKIKQWLDKKVKGSVVYIAFGSEAKPSQEELTEIALGLELSEIPFFWVLRIMRGTEDTELIKLPEGFEERTRLQGVVYTSWVPQLSILSHDSVGGFLTHSGWSSVVEALQFERALILLTFLADQGLNARLLEEKKIGYSIPRNELDGSFTRESVAESLRLVMLEDGGKVFRDKAKEMKGVFGDMELQDGYVDRFLSYLHEHKRGK